MEKVLEISGKKVTFRKTGKTMLAYKRQTGRDFLADLTGFLGCCKKDENGEFIIGKDGKPEIEMNKTLFDFDYMYDILHTMARQYDESILPDVLDWLDTFEDFPVVQIFTELLPMFIAEMQTNPKNA